MCFINTRVVDVISFRYGETVRHLKVSPGEHIGISPHTLKKTKPPEESSIRDYLLQ